MSLRLGWLERFSPLRVSNNLGQTLYFTSSHPIQSYPSPPTSNESKKKFNSFVSFVWFSSFTTFYITSGINPHFSIVWHTFRGGCLWFISVDWELHDEGTSYVVVEITTTRPSRSSHRHLLRERGKVGDWVYGCHSISSQFSALFSPVVARPTQFTNMEIPARASHPLALPSIHIEDSNPHGRFRASASRSSSYHSVASPTSIPMSIPNAREPVPPPLPPPKHLADIASGGNNGPDIAWKWGNSADGSNAWGGSFAPITPGSSLLGGGASSRRTSTLENHLEHSRRPSSTSTVKPSQSIEREPPISRFDEGYHSLSGTSIGSHRSVFPHIATSLLSGDSYMVLASVIRGAADSMGVLPSAFIPFLLFLCFEKDKLTWPQFATRQSLFLGFCAQSIPKCTNWCIRQVRSSETRLSTW